MTQAGAFSRARRGAMNNESAVATTIFLFMFYLLLPTLNKRATKRRFHKRSIRKSVVSSVSASVNGGRSIHCSTCHGKRMDEMHLGFVPGRKRDARSRRGPKSWKGCGPPPQPAHPQRAKRFRKE